MALPNFHLIWIEHGSTDYSAWVEFREPILRRPIGLSFSEADLEAEKKQLHLVAKSDLILGGLILIPGEGGVGKIRQVAVTEELQSSGLGRILMAEAEKHAASLGLNEIVLHSRETVNRFYEKLGYHPEGEIFEEVSIPHQKMKKRL